MGGAGRWAALLAIGAAIAAVVVQRLRPAPVSLLCRPGGAGDCGFDAGQSRFDLASSITADVAGLQAAASSRFREAQGQGRSPSLLYIGPHYTAHELEEGAMLDFQRHLKQWSPRMVFVDPNPRVIPLLKEKLTSLGIAEAESTVLHAAVCDQDGEQNFYMASERLFKDRQMDEAARTELEFGMSMIRGYTEGAGVPPEYVESVPVKCFTPTSLLDAVQLGEGGKGGPDVLLIDAEGYDLGIMERLLAVEGFRPSVAVFEWSGVFKIVSADRSTPGTSEEKFDFVIRPTLQKLRKAGYSLYQHDGDIWALLEL